MPYVRPSLNLSMISLTLHDWVKTSVLLVICVNVEELLSPLLVICVNVDEFLKSYPEDVSDTRVEAVTLGTVQ